MLRAIALPAASLLRGTHPAHAARRARAPAASTPHAPGHQPQTPDTTHERRRTTTKRCCVPIRAQSRRRRSMGHVDTGRSPRQRGPVARAGGCLFPLMREWLKQSHGRHHKAPPQPCALTTFGGGVHFRHSAARPNRDLASQNRDDEHRPARTTNSYLSYFSRSTSAVVDHRPCRAG